MCTLYRMYKCLNFKIEFPFEQRSILCEYNIECLLCPRNEKNGSDVKREKEKKKPIQNFFLTVRKVANIHLSIIVKMTTIFA
jgi:hypothetical protein